MKRLLIAAVVLSSIGVFGVSEGLGCKKYVAVGDHGEATVTFTDAEGRVVNIHTVAFGNFVVGAVNTGGGDVANCPPQIQPTEGYVEIKIDGALVCRNTNKPPAFDPFVFGGGIHNDLADPCGADVTWDGLSWMIAPAPPPGLPKPLPLSLGNKAKGVWPGTNVWAGDAQPAIVDGIYWLGGPTLNVPTGTVGWFSNHGAQVRIWKSVP